MSDSTKPLVLYTAPTPNGISVSIFLEDLRAINSVVDYEWACTKAHQLCLTSVVSVEKISIQNNTQKVHNYTLATACASLNVNTIAMLLLQEPWFIKMNPNGRIPVLTDRSRGDFHVFETSAIMLYLAQHYDKGYGYWFDSEKDPKDYSEMLQWIFFAVRF